MNSLFNHDQSIYSIDTSALIAAFHERYPIENFPSLWRKIETLIKNGRLKMSQTEENPTYSRNRPKIPDACTHFHVECIKIVDVIKRENWIFE